MAKNVSSTCDQALTEPPTASARLIIKVEPDRALGEANGSPARPGQRLKAHEHPPEGLQEDQGAQRKTTANIS